MSRLRRGRKLGKYQLDTRLGEGGFATVWRARDLVEQRWVALKVSEPVQHGSVLEEVMSEEVRIGASLDHPNVLPIRNADRYEDRYLLAMDLATEPLADRMRRRLSAMRALSYIHQMLLGLDYAHERNIVHRDIKPSNLLLFEDDTLRLADFGLSIIVHHTLVTASSSGTLYYMAPEQAHGRPGATSDVFSLGLVIYEMLTGVLPRFPFEWPFERASKLRSKMPQVFCEWLRKATQPDYRRRHTDGMQMLATFERLLPTIRRHIDPSKQGKRRRPKVGHWRNLRHNECKRLYGKRLFLRFVCPTCSGPISEHMTCCPWCGLTDFHFIGATDFPHYHDLCGRGLLSEWHFCPWCWAPGMPDADGKPRKNPRYHSSCERCELPMIEGMRYCPWCHAKRRAPISIPSIPDHCEGCKSSVTREFWDHCPWCARTLA